LSLIAWCVLANGAGCSNSDESSKRDSDAPTRLTARSGSYLAGVPVPKGFDIAERVTDSYEGAGMRFARQQYVGSADPYAVREFYKEHMPNSGWQYVSCHDIKGSTSIRFESGTEECAIIIEPGGFFNRTRIQVIVKPFKRGVSEPPPRRPMP
jgi:hypothetical protein